MLTWGVDADAHEVAGFTDVDLMGAGDRLRAVVVRLRSRSDRANAQPVGDAGVPAPHDDAELERGDWSGATQEGTPAQVRYSHNRAVVEVEGREHALPTDGRVLLILVDARTDDGSPTTETHVVDGPAMPRARLDSSRGREAFLEDYQAQNRTHREIQQRWLAEEPLVQGFLGRLTVGGNH